MTYAYLCIEQECWNFFSFENIKHAIQITLDQPSPKF
uniref:Uncharacterized protein n=1 Tax=Rhizophora mucronata TaxID=61149 RepID=A0A2P2N219_RHIMU